VVRPRVCVFVKSLGGILVFLVVSAATVAGSSVASAAVPEPLLVVSSASYDRWYDNVEFIGTVSGSPDLAQGLEAMLRMATANRGLVGLDKTRPWAGVVIPGQAEEDLFVDAYVCLPVNDLTALLEAVRPLVKGVHHYDGYGGGTHQIDVCDGFSLMAIPKGRWAVVAPLGFGTAGMYSVDDPTTLLGDMPKQYDLAARLFVPRLFEIKSLGQGDALSRSFGADLAELEHATVGLAFDHKARQMSAELVLVAKDKTPTAQRLSGYARKKLCPLAGFRLPGAAIEGTWSGTLTARTAMRLKLLTSAAQVRVLNDSNREDETTEAARVAVADVFAAIGSLCAGRRMEGAVSVVLGPEAVTWVSAVRLPPDGLAREQIKRLASLAKYDPQATTQPKPDADRDGEVRLRSVSIPISDRMHHGATLARMFGQRVDVVVGLGKEHVYLAFGRNAPQSLHEALAALRESSPALAAPVECSVATGPVAELAAALTDGRSKADVALIAQVLKPSAGKDHVRFSAAPVERGMRLRVEFEEGTLSVAGLVAGLLGQRAASGEPAAVE